MFSGGADMCRDDHWWRILDDMTKKFTIKVNGKKVGEIKATIYGKQIGLGSFEIYPQYRNKGYGTKALKRLINELKKDYDLIYCFIDKDNDVALHIYKKLGEVRDVGEQYQAVFYDKSGEYK